LDASSYIHRAFHAVKGLSTSQGLPTGAVFGFTQMLLSLLKQVNPEYLGVIYDHPGPTFRHRRYPAYKANRPPLEEDLKVQFEPVRQIVAALGLPSLEEPGYEADDLMATVTVQARKHGFRVVLVSGDKDLMQLVGPEVSMWDTMKDLHIGREEVRARLGVYPEQVVDYLSLAGDSSDNLPGISGVGPKTAARLLAQYGSLEAILAQAYTIKGKLGNNLLAEAGQARLSRELACLSLTAPVNFSPDLFKPAPARRETLAPLLTSLEFHKLAREMSVPAVPQKGEWELITSLEQLAVWLERAEKAGRLCLDTETTGLDPFLADLVGLALAVEPGRAAYIPLAHIDPEREQLPAALALKALEPLLLNPAVEKIGQNLKYDLHVLARAGLKLAPPMFDDMLADYLLDPGKSSHSLAAIALEQLGRGMISFEEATGGKNASFAAVTLDKALDYAAEDADVTLSAALAFKPQLEKAGLNHLFYQVEMPLLPVLAQMEANGVLLDLPGLDGLSQELARQIARLEEECYKYAGHVFNLNSPQQLGQVLFAELGLPLKKKTKKTGAYSTDMQVLGDLAAIHPLPAALLEYRTLSKLKSTYIDALPSLLNPHTGRVHTSFNQAVTATGRLSSSDPNLQNIPVRSQLGNRIRACFVAAPGCKIISADYSQIELRVLAHLSQDEALLADMRQGLDVHTQTAARLFDVHPGLVSQEMRRRAKTVNFGVLYGMSAFRLAREQKLELREAQDIIRRYLGRYPGIAAFQQACLTQARDQGYVSTILGRRRFLPLINSRDRVNREGAERMALNTPIQGSAADIIKLAMLNTPPGFPQARMILQVHDELVFECPSSQAEEFAFALKTSMERVFDLKVPLLAEVGIADNWAGAH
jgi:DNA polymerase-1